MKAAALGHQYLTVRSQNKNDGYFSNGRSRGDRRRFPESQRLNRTDEDDFPPVSATDPSSRRSNTFAEDAPAVLPSVGILGRSISDHTEHYDIFPGQPSLELPADQHEDHAKPHSLASIVSKRYGNGNKNDKLSSRVRRFYKKQDELIDCFEQLHNGNSETSAVSSYQFEKEKRITEWLVRATVVVNCSLLIAKIVAAIFSHSLSIISSVVDSAVDSASACLLFWAVRAIKRKNPYSYPAGRTRLEPIIIVILSVVMVSASVQVIFESVESIIDDAQEFSRNSTGLRRIDMGPVPITVMCVTVVTKAILSFLCFRVSNPTMRAVAQDHLNDVFSNIIALVCGTVAAKALSGAIKPTQVVLIDPIGAILVSLYIIFCWVKQLREQVRNLSGYKAEPEFLQKITWITLNHSPFIRQIDTVRAFHFGTSFLVEVEIILPETMSLKEAHGIGDSLQEKLEKLSEVELAFVHLDYAVDPLQY